MFLLGYNDSFCSLTWSGNQMPIPMAIGPAIGHVRACHSWGATVSVVSTTAQLTVERSIDLAIVGRTMMKASLVWPDALPQSGYARLDGGLVTMTVLKRHNRDYPLKR